MLSIRNRRQANKRSRNLLIVLLFVALVVGWIAFRLLRSGPHNPERFFLDEVRRELASFSDVLLTLELTDRVTIARRPYTKGTAQVVVGSGVPDQLLDDINALMKSHDWHYLYIDKQEATVGWASLMFRQLIVYQYIPSENADHIIPKHARSVRKIASTWYLFLIEGS